MKIILLCPFSKGPTRGNIITVQRIASYLNQMGCPAELLALDLDHADRRLLTLVDNPPDLLHGFHAFQAGPKTRSVASYLQIPYIITLTGSDLFDPAMRDHADTKLVLQDAAGVTCFDQQVAALARQSFPFLADKLHIIHQGVEPPGLAEPVQRDAGQFVILLPAALRPVKGIDFAIEQLAPLAAELPQLVLWVAGGVLDAGYAAQLDKLAASLPFVRFLGEVPYQQIGSVYAAADLVLNSSEFEGGMANALLEAMALGRPVIARDIAGNRTLVQDGVTGWLFKDGEQLRNQIKRVVAAPAERHKVAENGRRQVLERFSPKVEAALFYELYRSALTGITPGSSTTALT